MSALPSFPPIRLGDGTVLVPSQTTDQIRTELTKDTVNDLKEAVEKGWYIHGHAAAPELAAEAIDAFSVGVARLDALKHAAIREYLGMRQAEVLFGAYVLSATVYAAEQLADMMDDGKRITFGPKQ
jgi:hypothetical protein